MKTPVTQNHGTVKSPDKPAAPAKTVGEWLDNTKPGPAAKPAEPKKARYDGQDVLIVRDAKDGDNGFDPNSEAGKQVFIKFADGAEKVVMKGECVEAPVEKKPA